MSVLNPNHRGMRATENQWPRIAARLLIKLPREGARVTVVVTAAGEASWNPDAGTRRFWTAKGGRHGFDWATAEPCEGMRVAFYRETPTEAA
ncbi:hypothetical protein QFZ97_006880 [Paraburkholderia youngii]